jgi:SAM-dependent methyltransferase
VATGTGVLARRAAERVGPAGAVTGYDLSPGMLAVAARLAPGLRWERGPAERLPFPDASFDTVVSQFGLMFFEDRSAALGEILRVLRPGRQAAVAVWGSLGEIPAFGALADLLERHAGAGPAGQRAIFSVGDPAALLALARGAGCPAATVTSGASLLRFPSVAAWLHTEVRAWAPVGEHVDAATYARLVADGERALAPFVTPDGSVAVRMVAHILTLPKP